MAETAKTTMSAIGDARRTQIMQAARTICLEKGFSKITISDIAEHVGMTRSLFYHYFQDKNQVADAVLDDVINEVIARLEEWNEHRETGNISKALDDVVRLTRSLIADEGPFSQRLIEDGNAGQIVEHLELGIAIRLEALMPMQVIGCDVEHDSHIRRKLSCRVELVRRDFTHVNLGFARCNRLKANLADVAHGICGQACLMQHMGRARRGCGLAVRTGDCHPRAVGCALAPREFDFADQLGRACKCILIELVVERNAGAGNAHVEMLFDTLERFIAKRKVDVLTSQRLDKRDRIVIARTGGNEQLVDARADERSAIARNSLSAHTEAEHEHGAKASRGTLRILKIISHHIPAVTTLFAK